MQAAVVSVLLMAGACGDSGETLPAPAPAATAIRGTMDASTAVPVCIPSATFHGAGSGAYFHTVLHGCHDYSPVWFLHDCAAYYPGNYAQPYDYREQFNYPWHGPHPYAQVPASDWQIAAKPTTKLPTVVR